MTANLHEHKKTKNLKFKTTTKERIQNVLKKNAVLEFVNYKNTV
jgi:hypothetical protein